MNTAVVANKNSQIEADRSRVGGYLTRVRACDLTSLQSLEIKQVNTGDFAKLRSRRGLQLGENVHHTGFPYNRQAISFSFNTLRTVISQKGL